MRPLPSSQVFTTAQGRHDGATSASLKYATDRGRLLRPIRGVYARPDVPEAVRDDRAAAIRYPAAVLCDTSSARQLEIPLVSAGAAMVEMTVEPRSNADLPGIHPYRARLREHEICLDDGRLRTSAARTVIDLARHRKLITSVPALDYVLHTGLASAEEIADVLDFCRNWPGMRRARRAVSLCDSRSESPLESVSRLALPKLGIPAPEPQVLIVDRNGVVVARSDFYWDEQGVVGEADGRGKYVDRDVLDAEKQRHEQLDDVCVEVTRWGWVHVWRDRRSWARRLQRALMRGANRDRAGLPRPWTPESTPRIEIR